MAIDVGHVLSPKSLDLGRDTFIFVTLSHKSELYFGVNQKSTPVSSATIHRWAKLIHKTYAWAEFFLCPVTVLSAGIMSYYVQPSGPAIEPYSTELLPPGNYGWYFDRECIYKGYPRLVRRRLYTFETCLESEAEYFRSEFLVDAIPPAAEANIAVTRDANQCRFTGSEEGTMLAWIIPPSVAWETDDFGHRASFDKTPFPVAANLLTIQSDLRFYLHNNHFMVDVDDGYRILVLRGMGDMQGRLPTHLPCHSQHDPAADHFLRLHCRYSLNLMLLGGDIKEVYPNGVITGMMEELGVDYAGSEDRDEKDMAFLDDERWQSELGKAIMEGVLEGKIAQRLYEDELSTLDVDEDEDSEPPSSGPNSRDEKQEPWPESPLSLDWDSENNVYNAVFARVEGDQWASSVAEPPSSGPNSHDEKRESPPFLEWDSDNNVDKAVSDWIDTDQQWGHSMAEPPSSGPNSPDEKQESPPSLEWDSDNNVDKAVFDWIDTDQQWGHTNG
ncbi:hypothetical protein B0H17DRAFT_1339272 [Mycena rosella]|uniref:Uncharacterized protein n=1 Tax=Mycena rosella TaxID=1033263 RepID=A0AAD7C6D6_MYCRO|nr:hypothetical protein B0H17DRAFT_1339272 [Mycena rosella]